MTKTELFLKEASKNWNVKTSVKMSEYTTLKIGGSADVAVFPKTANALRDAANNEGAGGFGAQLGSGIAFGEMMKNAFNSEPQQTEVQGDVKFCPKCGAKNARTSKFCTECGEKLK